MFIRHFGRVGIGLVSANLPVRRSRGKTCYRNVKNYLFWQNGRKQSRLDVDSERAALKTNAQRRAIRRCNRQPKTKERRAIFLGNHPAMFSLLTLCTPGHLPSARTSIKRKKQSQMLFRMNTKLLFQI